MERIDRGELTYTTLIALIEGLLDDHTSHTVASAEGWSYVPSPEEVFFYNELDVKIASNRGKNQPAPQPVKRPWEQPKVSSRAAHDPEHDARLDRLKQRLGLTPEEAPITQ